MPTTVASRTDASYGIHVAALAIFYFAAAKVSLLLAIPPGYATAVWPPSGIAFAGLLIWGTSAWPGIWLGAMAANYAVNGSVPVSALIATGNTLEGLCAAWLASRLLCREFCFRQPDAVFLFAAIAAVSSVVAATVGVSTLYLAGGVEAASYFANWYTWWQGDTTGIILVTPLVLAWSRVEVLDERRPPRSEVAIFWTLLAATLASVFGGFSRGELAGAMEFLLIPFMAWAGCRFSERQVTLVVVAAAGTAVWGAIEGRGPYRLLTLNESLLVLQAFASTLALMALVLYAATQQRADAIRVLEIWRDYLRNIVRDRAGEANDASERLEETQALAHIGSWTLDSAGRAALSNELYRICGLAPEPRGGESLEAFLGRVHPDDRLLLRRAIDRARADRRPWDMRVRLTRPDGALRVVQSLGEAVVNRAGAGQRLRGTCIDVTEQARLEQALAACEGRLLDVSARAESERKRVVAELRDGMELRLEALKLGLESWVRDSHEQPGPWTRQTIAELQAELGRALEALRFLVADLQAATLEDGPPS